MANDDTFACGVDEAGRGPLAGPVFAAAVILDPNKPIDGLNDSKKLSAKKRAELEILIKERALSWSVASASEKEIDEINILQASMLAMKRAVESLSVVPTHAYIDGNKTPDLNMPATAIVGGDASNISISAASILAKEARDRDMKLLAQQYPGYGLEGHMGYPTKAHVEALEKLGPSPIHRQSFGPVKKALAAQQMKKPKSSF